MRKSVGFTVLTAAVFLFIATGIQAGPPRPGDVPRVVIGPAQEAAPEALAALRAQNQGATGLIAVGFERAMPDRMVVEFGGRLPETLPAPFAGGLLSRSDAGEFVWSIRLSVAGAQAIRLRLQGVYLPEGTWFTATGRGEPSPERFGADTIDRIGELLSPMIEGSTALMTLTFPVGIAPAGSFEVAGIHEIFKPELVTDKVLAPLASVEHPDAMGAPGAVPESIPSYLAPAPPSMLTATVTGPNTILLQWQRNSTNEKSFKIQRRNGTSGSYKKVGTTGTGVTAYTDATVTPGSLYTYRVKSANASGASGPSNEVQVTAGTPGAFTVHGVATCSANAPVNNLDWTSSLGATTYDVMRNGATLTAGLTGLLYSDAAITASQPYTYQIVARNAYGSASTITINLTTKSTADCCPAPGSTTLSASPGCTSGSAPKIALTWTASTGAASYDLYRNGVIFQPTISGTSFTDTAVTAGLGYNYYVVAKSTCGQNTSTTVSATAPTTCCPPPGGPFTLTVTPGCLSGSPGMFLHWTAATGVPNSSSYDIYVDGVLAFTNKDQTITWFYGAPASSTHSFFIRAKNSCGTLDSNIGAAVAPASCTFTAYVDELDPGFHPHGPAVFWYGVTNAHCYNNHMYYTANTAGPPATSINWAEYFPNLAGGGAGVYTVSAYIPCLPYATTSNADYFVMHGAAISGMTPISQLAYCDGWASIGSFYCWADGADLVNLGDGTGEPTLTTDIGFDAIRWEKGP